MSLPAWFYPMAIVWVISQSLFNAQDSSLSEWRRRWEQLLNSLFLLPWILGLIHNEPAAAWLGFEVLSLILLADALWSKPSARLQEAWTKLGLSWFLSWLLIGSAAAISGVHILPAHFFFPVPEDWIERFRPVFAAALFTIGLALKLGFPVLQQGLIDFLEVSDYQTHRRWALPLRLAMAYAIWQLTPDIWGPLTRSNQELFAVVLILGATLACLVASVQASVQRTLSYMGSGLLLPLIVASVFIEPRLGFAWPLTLAMWGLTLLGFFVLTRVYQQWPDDPRAEEPFILLWSDPSAPTPLTGFQRWFKAWTAWMVISSLFLFVESIRHQLWFISFASIALGLAAATAGTRQLGIRLRRQIELPLSG